MVIGILLVLSGIVLVCYGKSIYGLVALGFGLLYLYLNLHSIRKEQTQQEELPFKQDQDQESR